VVVINQDASVPALEWLIDNTFETQGVQITYPMCLDESGEAFTAYDAFEELLPSIFLVDQTGIIRLRFDGADSPDTFLPKLEEIKSAIEELLEDPPGG
jgi:alkyl hydroperoxide reductase subunit AhpC